MANPTRGTNTNALVQHLQAVEHISPQDIQHILDDATAVFKQCIAPGKRGVTQGLIYGNIQSGKTAVILALIALATDSGYERFIVLTSDLNDLYDQTLNRTRQSLHGLTVMGKPEIRNANVPQSAHKSVLVVSKNVRMLQSTLTLLGGTAWSGKTVMIIDDEADQASLDTKINTPAQGPSGVNRDLAAIRRACTSLAFVQTTATPQALLLQDAQSPSRPGFVHVTTPGTDYCGGDLFFVDENFANPRYLRFVPVIDVVNLRANSTLPPSLEDSIYSFFIAAALLRLGGSQKNYQSLIHTSLKKAEHQLVAPLVTRLYDTIASALLAQPRATPQLVATVTTNLRSAYDDLRAGSTTFSFQQVLQDISNALPSTEVVEINSRTGQGVQADPNRRHVLYVGGTKLGRGVTIKNLLMTYYARDAQSPQIDTILQHARMYGYRRNELPYTRIYLPDHLAERFRQIHISDNAMRDVARQTGQAIPVIPIPIRRLQSTRRNVLSKQSVELTTFLGGRQYYPLVPVSSGAALLSQTARLDRLLVQLCPRERIPTTTSITALLTLLSGVFGSPGSPGAWDDELVRLALSLRRSQTRVPDVAQLVVGSRSSDVGKLDTRGMIHQIQALLPANAGNPPYGTQRNVPVLVFMRLNGGTAKGWDGQPFWVPNVRFPDGNYAFSLNRT